MKQTIKMYVIAAVVVVVAVAIGVGVVRCTTKNDGFIAENDHREELTPLLVDSIQSIGEWQLQTVDLETQVDTTRRRWLGLVTDRLVRRYYGRMSIGLDLSHLPEGWHKEVADTVFLTIPPVTLLDSAFIDESRTRLISSDNDEFAEDATVRKAMLEKAWRQMVSEGMTPALCDSARHKAEDELIRRFRQIGYKKVVVSPS